MRSDRTDPPGSSIRRSPASNPGGPSRLYVKAEGRPPGPGSGANTPVVLTGGAPGKRSEPDPNSLTVMSGLLSPNAVPAVTVTSRASHKLAKV